MAFKFFLRSLGGGALFVASADLLRDADVARRTAIGIAVGAAVAALAAIAEVYLPAGAGLLSAFHPQSFQVLGLVRASGTFQFPNIAAMYFEAVIPLVVAMGACVFPRARAQVVAVSIAVMLLGALILTASRAGLATAAVSLAILALVGRHTGRIAGLALISLGGLVALIAVGQLAGSDLGLRQRFWRDSGWYRSSITQATTDNRQSGPTKIEAGRTVQVSLVVRNEGAATWPAHGPRPVRLGHHWIDAKDKFTTFDGERAALPADLAPGSAETLSLTIRAPMRPGSYVLWWDLVRQDVTWFSERGDPGHRETVEVVPRTAKELTTEDAKVPAPPQPTPSSLPLAPTTETSRTVLWRAAIAAFRDYPIFGIGPDNFRHVYGRYAGIPDADDRFHANSLYFETLADEGLIGLVGLTVLLVTLSWTACRAFVRSAGMTLGLCVALGTYFLHGTVDYFFEFTPTYGLFWLLAGMLVALAEPSAKSMPERPVTAAA